MLHAALTRHGVVRGNHRDLVEAAALVLAHTPGPYRLKLADLPQQASEEIAAA